MASTSRERASRLHEVAKALLPIAAEDSATVLAKPKNIYIVLERADRPCNLGQPDIDSFLWIKGNKKISFAKLLEVHRARCPDALDVELTVGGNTMDDQATVGDVPDIKDQLVVVSAIKCESPAPTPSFSNAASSQSSVRQPLQPVNRQLSTPLKRSADELPVKREVRSPGGLSPAQPMLAAAAIPQAATRLASNPTPGAIPTAATPKREPKNEDSDDAAEVPYVPRDRGNPFAEQQNSPEPEPGMRGIPLSELIKDDTPERLEAGVETGLQFLSKLEKHMRDLGSGQDSQNWLNHIEKTRQEAIRSRTVVGVVGNTGAGKSSVINAMLDEERLVPTNCMRACTAVVTEISYNYSKNPAAKYRAEIEFIQFEDWEKELKVLFQELFDDSGNFSREIYNADSEAGIAFSKVRAVYNTYTKEQLSTASVDSLLSNKKVKSLLGTSKKVIARDAKSFYRQLQSWIDSKEKGTEKLDKNGNRIGLKIREFEAWPLIKVVKIYTQSPALSTGACIVDLPGVHDSNAARAAVANGYMKQCTGLWIVAPITRAVDDRAAKTLLGDSFKRQLKFDGTYSAVTFICSKTDDISKSEAMESLGLNKEVADLNDKMTVLRRRRRELEKEEEEIKAKQEDFDSTMEQIHDDTEVWDKLLEDLEDGKTVFAPSKSTKKRKAGSTSPHANKRRRRAVDSDDEDTVSLEDRTPDQQHDPAEASTEPLTEDNIQEKLDELKQLKKEARREKRALAGRIEELRNLIDTVEIELADLDAQENAICIDGRNQYSRDAIRQDFAAGIRELDQETAEEEDPDNFDPTNDARDYEEVAASLPVFCVSSRAYQKLAGRMQRDNDVAGFTEIDQTEIPQLQAHAKALTVKGRQASCRSFLNKLRVLTNSIALWASDDGSGVKLSEQQRDVEKAWLARKVKDLEKALENAVEENLNDVVETLNEQLFEKFGQAVDAASQNAVTQAQGWGARRDEGGLHHGTYAATMRRDGTYRRDFNVELTDPMYKVLSTVWEKVFVRRVPSILRGLKRSATNVLKHFHSAVDARARQSGRGLSRIMMLAQSLDAYSVQFEHLCERAVELLNEKQKEVNREFTPAILQAMRPVYQTCAEERGKGMFARMKAHMAQHVSDQQDVMFKMAAEQVRASLLKLAKNIRENMLDGADQLFVSMSRDYTQNDTVIKLTREERALRRTIDEVVAAADKDFREVLEQDPEELKKIIAAPQADEAPNAQDDFCDETEDLNDDGENENFENGRDDAASDNEDTLDARRSVEPDADRSLASYEDHHIDAEQTTPLDGAMAAPAPSTDTTEE